MTKRIFTFITILAFVTIASAQFSSNIDYSDKNKSNMKMLERNHFLEVVPIMNQKNVSWQIALEDSAIDYNSSIDATQLGLRMKYNFPIENSFCFGVETSISNWNKRTELYYKSLETGVLDTVIDLPSIDFNDFYFGFEISDLERIYLAKISTKIINYSESKNYQFYSFYGEYNLINDLRKKDKQQLGLNFTYEYHDEQLNNISSINLEREYSLLSSFYTFNPIYSFGLKYKKINKEFTYYLSSTYFAYPDSLYRSDTGMNIEVKVDYKLLESSLKFSIDLGVNLGMDFNNEDFVFFDKAIPIFYYSIGAGSFLFSKNLYIDLKWRYSQTPLLTEEDILLNSAPLSVPNFEEIMITNDIKMSFKYFF